MTMMMLMQDDANDDDEQSLFVQGWLVDKPNEPKSATLSPSILYLTHGEVV